MSRWRPHSPSSSPYITPEGYQRLESELQALWDRRKDVTKALTAAAAEGDRSENAEYIYRKKELREIDRRIRYLQTRMPKLKVVSEVGDKNRIFFGAVVTIENEYSEKSTYRIVGADEIDADKNYISIDSPMSKALLGKTFDDDVIVKIEGKVRRYVIATIEYK
ncbi:MAG: transcription elongation factor GreB [Gammaproteobacteria bacterium RIFCSPLOWO2_02_FULL_47_50]|nr:MAG: transcription elongation factor GreB [Gammaproteobacteria bacterium RIFCSPLOWO2_02_FULL_47_50]